MNTSSGMSEPSTVSTGPTLKPYLRRKKSSLGETKVAVLGMEGVGKSALSVRFLTKRFIGEYDQSMDTYEPATSETSPPAETSPDAETSPPAETSPDAETSPPAETSPDAETSPPAETSPDAKTSSPAETSPDAEISPEESQIQQLHEHILVNRKRAANGHLAQAECVVKRSRLEHVAGNPRDNVTVPIPLVDRGKETKYKCTTNIDGESVAFELLDTRSFNDDHGTREEVLRWADGFMLVYSVTSRKSFDILQDVRKKIEEAKKAGHAPVIVVGNKADLAHVRQVTQDEGQKLAVEFSCPFLEVSASEDVIKVIEAFHILCKEIIEFKRRSRTFLDRVFGLKKS